MPHASLTIPRADTERDAAFDRRARDRVWASLRIRYRSTVAIVALLTATMSSAFVHMTAHASNPIPADVAAPSTIAPDCSVDVTTALGDWLRSVPTPAIVQLRSNACYRVDGTIELRGRRDLTIEGNGATLQTAVTGAPTRAHLRFIGGSGLSLRNFTVRGANPNGGTSAAYNEALQYQHGIDVRGVVGVNIDRIQVTDVYGDCFYFGLGYDGVTWSRDVVVANSTCRANGRQGIALVASEGVSITGSAFSQVGLIGVDVEPNGGRDGVQNVVVRDNTFGTSRQWFFAAVGDSGGGVVDGITVDRNTVVGRSLALRIAPSAGQRWSNVAVTNNTSTHSEYYNGNGSVMDVSSVDGLTITGNQQPAAGNDQVLVQAADSCAVDVNSNSFSGGLLLVRRIGTYSCGTISPSTTTSTTTTLPATSTTSTLPATSTTSTLPATGQLRHPPRRRPKSGEAPRDR